MKVIRIIMATTLVFCLTFTLFFGRYKIVDGGVDTTPEQYKGVITMWQIDSFEGGVGSRKQFLLKAARGFEKERNGVLIMVINQTVEGARESMEKGEYPDLISYGCGAEIRGYGKITPSQTVIGAMVGADCYATAWCRGGYALIFNPTLVDEQYIVSNEFDDLLVSQAQFTQPLTALIYEGISVKNVEVLSPMDAYVKYTLGKTKCFLATQRDIHRLNNRGVQYLVRPLENFNDLYQYVSVTSIDQTKRYYAQLFVEYLISEKVQNSLSEIGMFSPYIETEYLDQTLIKMQKNNKFATISAFTYAEQLKEMQKISHLALKGDTSSVNKIKNMCVMP